jgi:L-histidine N-alpha-methyltransferase
VQERLLYQPIDISPSALVEARAEIEARIPGVTVRSQVANYITDPYRIDREPNRSVLALYIGSSIGNFSPEEARGILANLRRHIRPGDALLLGTDLAPSAKKSVEALLAAYDDAQGVTAAFNCNILTRLNRDLSANFAADGFRHQVRWNAKESRIAMHLESLARQTVHVPANSSGPDLKLQLAKGETIHTENSYKFTEEMIEAMLVPSGFTALRTFQDADHLFAVTLASAT